LSAATHYLLTVKVNHNKIIRRKKNPLRFKGIVQRILRGIRPRKLEARPFFFLNCKGTPLKEEYKTIFSG
jgi:hypothetical protein